MRQPVRLATFGALLALLPLAAAPSGQTPPPFAEQEAVLAVIDEFMTALSTNDFARMSRIRLDGGATIVERPAAGGGTQVTRRVFQADTQKPGSYRERYWDPVVHIRGRLAVVWTPYEFWQDGKTSHCGIDVFDMVKEDAGWRIANAMWTVEPDACPALRPSDPGRIRPK